MLKKILITYLSSWWFPTLFAIIVSALLFISSYAFRGNSSTFLIAHSAAFFLSIMGLISASIYNTIQKKWLKSVVNLISFIIFGAPLVLFFSTFYFFGDSKDDFAKGLAIPPNIEAITPTKEMHKEFDWAEDNFQQSILQSLNTKGDDNPMLLVDISALNSAYKHNPENLLRYLATNPAWRLYTERGNLYASRRWIVNGHWKTTLNGYYTSSDLNRWENNPEKKFQTRTSINFSWPSSQKLNNVTVLISGENKEVSLEQRSGQFAQYGSRINIKLDPLSVEVTEQSSAKERRLTKASLQFLNNEFKSFDSTTEWNKIKQILPKGSIKTGHASLELTGSSGIYDVFIWANPGEAGMVYLKAFEVTKNTPLSAEKLKQSSSEWMGWSDNPQEQFLSNSNIMIYEGDWEQYYAARFEVWFVPSSGGSERKLFSRVFKIEGWMR